MKKDVLGKRELDSVKLNWDFAVPGLMTTRCCGTGTCDNRPITNPILPANINTIHFF
ncbi:MULTISPECIES: hypothetical protein [Parachlamydia]|uniref:hypothetical protein n=1 Tax=Parachlamydia TaxID=83551 RepID=UPI0024E1F283|nr:hypothetical protein [Parachlamydia acanthamoebae]